MYRKRKTIYGPLHHEIEKEQELYCLQKKFYSEKKEFSEFLKTRPDIRERIQNTLSSQFDEKRYPKYSLKRYQAILQFLTSAKGNEEFPTFDEKILFLINAIDPELMLYYNFLRTGYSLEEEEEIRNQKADALISFMKMITGTFDGQLLRYEELYFQKWLKYRDIVSFVKQDYSKEFFALFKRVESFNEVSESSFYALKNKAENYFANCDDAKSVTTICFNMKNPNNRLELYFPLQKIIFFLLVIDPDLNALRIFYDESNQNKIRERIKNELGFYHEDLIRIEKLFRERFYPEMRVDNWSL